MTKYISKERKGLLYIIAIAVMIALMCMACKKRVTQPASFSLEDTYIENETTTPSPTPDPEPTPEPENPTPPVVEPEPENPNPPTVEPEPTPKPEPPVVEPEPTPKPEPTPEPEPAPKPVLSIDKNKGLNQFIGKNFQTKEYPFEDRSGTFRTTAKFEKTGSGVRLVVNDYHQSVRKNPIEIYFDGRGNPIDKGNGQFAFPVYQNDRHKGNLNHYGSGDTTVIFREDGSLQINFVGFLAGLSSMQFTLIK